ncbi:Potassium/sodium hyperpolarization-activated cyclic nucleotide-gated channel 4 [Phlyctochytrium planicorne]|nr:Potassium/sodium hyperpolarization-activated cyclic nucleotide-gated channel 4 [Phlyctochytrium planicorne]
MSASVVDEALGELSELQQQLIALLGKVESTFKKLKRTTSDDEGSLDHPGLMAPGILRTEPTTFQKRSDSERSAPKFPSARPISPLSFETPDDSHGKKRHDSIPIDPFMPGADNTRMLGHRESLGLRPPNGATSRRGSMSDALKQTLLEFQNQQKMGAPPAASLWKSASNANFAEDTEDKSEEFPTSAVLELPLNAVKSRRTSLFSTENKLKDRELERGKLKEEKEDEEDGKDKDDRSEHGTDRPHHQVHYVDGKEKKEKKKLPPLRKKQLILRAGFNANGSLISMNSAKYDASRTTLQSLTNDPLDVERGLPSSVQNLKKKQQKSPPAFQGFHPRAFIASAWDILMTFTYCAAIWFIPLSMGFEKNEYLEYGITVFSSLMYTLDIIKIFLTRRLIRVRQSTTSSKVSPENNESAKAFNGVAKKDEEEILLTLAESQRYYVTHGFILDLLTVVPWNLIFSNSVQSSWMLLVVKMVRIWRLPFLIKRTAHFTFVRKRVEMAIGGGRALSNLVTLVAIFLSFLHIEGCIFFLIGRLTNFVNSPVAGSRNSTVMEQYAEAMFYAVSNTVPVAYNAMIIGTVSSLTNGIDASGKIYRQKLDELNDYMKWKKLPEHLKVKMRHYYNLKYRGKFFEEHSLLDTLNESLRNEIAMYNCRDLIDQVPFLQREVDDGRTQSFVGRIAKSMVACFYVKGDVICTEGELGMEMYFIVSGQVNVIVNKRRCAVLKDGQFFGELSMVAMIPRTATIVAGAPSVLYRLSRNDFLPILQDFEDVREKIAEIYQERIEQLKKEEEERIEEEGGEGDATILHADPHLDTFQLMSQETLSPFGNRLAPPGYPHSPGYPSSMHRSAVNLGQQRRDTEGGGDGGRRNESVTSY